MGIIVRCLIYEESCYGSWFSRHNGGHTRTHMDDYLELSGFLNVVKVHEYRLNEEGP